MDDLLRDFLTESAENLGKLDNDIVHLERCPDDASRLNSVFRTIHTIKGTCGFLGLARLESVAHAAESVLDALRSGRLTVECALIGDVLRAVDSIRSILSALEANEVEPEGDDSRVIGQLERWLNGSVEAATADSSACADNIFDVVVPVAPPVSTVSDTASTAAKAEETPQWGRRKEDHEHPPLNGDGTTLRVGVVLLDQLMNLVGELALGRNRLIQLAAAHEDSEFVHPVQQIDRITTDLLEAVMKTRMQPIGNAWTKLPRLVRDLSNINGKQIVLDMHGADTELDRQILQAIQDPLTHMIRNSADHGIESVAARQAAGKPAQGTIRLNAHHEGGHVIIEVSDDGAGINVARVREKAVERGLVKAEVAASLPDAQLLRYVFEPGFSTAAQITNVSGRGVGMDVVKSNIELIGGTVELSSKQGAGTTVRVKIPLTLAIISALLVGAAGETFAVPQIGVVELVRVTEEQHALIESVNGARFYRLRDTLLPLVSLHSVLKLGEMPASETYNIVVCQVEQARFGLVVQEVFDTQEIVVKPVGRLAKHLQVYAGCTITGDGDVIMILDTTGIASVSQVATHSRELTRHLNSEVQAEDNSNPLENVILFDAGYPALQAVPLSLVARLEEFPQSIIEEADGNFLVQYRGELIPIIAANPALDMRARDPRPVIVFSDANQTMGVAVDEIRDIVEDRIQLQQRAERAGVRGVCVIAGRATEVIDTNYFLQKAHGEQVGSTTDLHRDFEFSEYLAKLDRDSALRAVRSLISGLQEAA